MLDRSLGTKIYMWTHWRWCRKEKTQRSCVSFHHPTRVKSQEQREANKRKAEQLKEKVEYKKRRKRQFQPSWKLLFPWVEYSHECDSMYCSTKCPEKANISSIYQWVLTWARKYWTSLAHLASKMWVRASENWNILVHQATGLQKCFLALCSGLSCRTDYPGCDWQIELKLCSFFYRWDDDVVFKNCAKGDESKKVE